MWPHDWQYKHYFWAQYLGCNQADVSPLEKLNFNSMDSSMKKALGFLPIVKRSEEISFHKWSPPSRPLIAPHCVSNVFFPESDGFVTLGSFVREGGKQANEPTDRQQF